MNDDMRTTDGPAARRSGGWVRTAALLGGGVLAGAALAGVTAANAATTTPSPSTTSGSSSSSSSGQSGSDSTAQGQGHQGFGPGGSTPVRSDEKEVTGTLATTLTEKAQAKVPGATVIRVETDAGDAAYEVHLRKSDGSLVTVKFDKDSAITAVEDGMGKGDPAPSGQQGQQPPTGQGAPGGTAPSGSTTG